MTSAAGNNAMDKADGGRADRQPGGRRDGFEGLHSAGRRCLACQRAPSAGELMTAVLVELVRRGGEAGPQFQRLDYCPACWPRSPWAGGADALLDEGQSAVGSDVYGVPAVAVWTAPAATRAKPRRTFVDDAVLMNFFLRLADDPEPVRQQFRFVLMLILLRRRKLRYEGIERSPGGDAWRVSLMPAMAQATGAPPDQPHCVLDPRMDESQVQQAAGQLSQILQEDVDLADEENMP